MTVAFIPNALLSPREFADREGEAMLGDTRGEQFLTSRLRILVPDDGWYTFTRMAILYSHRLYVNGEFVTEIGSPGDSPATDTPDRGRITFTAQAVDGVIEIVQQSSNFVHRLGGWHHTWAMGACNALLDEVLVADFQVTIIMGGIFVLFLILMLLSYMLRGNNHGTLYCALFCLVWFLRLGVTGGVVFTVLAPWMNWFMKFRIDYITVPLAASLILAIVTTLFPGVLHKYFVRGFYALAASLVIVYLFADTILMSHIKQISYIPYGLTMVVVVVSLFVKVRKVNMGQGLFIIGLMAFIFASVMDILQLLISDYLPSVELSGVAMLIFALCKASAVFVATMRKIDAAKEAKEAAQHREMAILNDLIDQMTTMTANHQQGDIDAQIDTTRFEGAHKAVAQGVNEMTGAYVTHITELGAVLENFGAGDFNTVYNPLPGKKSFLNNAVENLRKNLKDIDGEIETLSHAAVKGHLSIRANPEGFKGDWKKLLVGCITKLGVEKIQDKCSQK